MGARWRRMYYRTGLPGWMRFGYSPGWAGRSSTGFPPAAEWIMSSGAMPQFREYLKTGRVSPSAPLTKEQEMQMLNEQAKAIESQLEATRRRLESLRKNPSTTQTPQTPYYPHYNASMPYDVSSPEEELALLEECKRNLEEEVKGVDARIEELKKLRERKSST
ncbi:MAG: DUF5320 domain-containing protein [Candidatus Methylarchaceae archaeon HK02M1]|nr:DUF5320 domain-containing protein [Candidatus Methylarchaceae archaeon HK02M1]